MKLNYHASRSLRSFINKNLSSIYRGSFDRSSAIAWYQAEFSTYKGKYNTPYQRGKIYDLLEDAIDKLQSGEAKGGLKRREKNAIEKGALDREEFDGGDFSDIPDEREQDRPVVSDLYWFYEDSLNKFVKEEKRDSFSFKTTIYIKGESFNYDSATTARIERNDIYAMFTDLESDDSYRMVVYKTALGNLELDVIFSK